MNALMSPRSVSYGLNTGAPNVRQAMVERRAYHIWKAKGCPKGTALKDWMQAEKEVEEAANLVGWCYLCRTPMPVDLFPK